MAAPTLMTVTVTFAVTTPTAASSAKSYISLAALALPDPQAHNRHLHFRGHYFDRVDAMRDNRLFMSHIVRFFD